MEGRTQTTTSAARTGLVKMKAAETVTKRGFMPKMWHSGAACAVSGAAGFTKSTT